jgi:3-methyladenine DNA glycosylase AlkD
MVLTRRATKAGSQNKQHDAQPDDSLSTKLITLQQSLASLADPKFAINVKLFFKMGENEYGAHDVFIGVRVPLIRSVAIQHFTTTTDETLISLLSSRIHEERLLGLLILVQQYQKSTVLEEKRERAEFYLSHLYAVNNWDLVDLTATKILGHYLYHHHEEKQLPTSKQTGEVHVENILALKKETLAKKGTCILYELSMSSCLWYRRVGIVASLYHVTQNSFTLPVQLSRLLCHDEEDIVCKAVGWILKEMGKRNESRLKDWLDKHWQECHPTVVRVAVEKLKNRKKYLQLLKSHKVQKNLYLFLITTYVITIFSRLQTTFGRLCWVHSCLFHLDIQGKEVVTHYLGTLPRFHPYIDAMCSYDKCVCLWMRFRSLCKYKMFMFSI